MKKIFVFGNMDLEMDNLPLRILSQLVKKFPGIEFVVKDPNEEWEVLEELVVLDTAVGIKEVTIFDSLEKFSKPPRVGMHDFDALTNLRFLWKLGKIKKIKIIAVPQNLKEDEAVLEVSKILEKI
ncbi:MAG: hypothetical protein AAB446_00915 [Patescibacteria group bacterium]